ncbi:MAG: hypothetical protein AAGE93_24335 [Bacteroidota bacterium]
MFKIIGYLLVVVHLFLGVWATGGFIEMVLKNVPWKPFTNPEFPDWLLVIHWGAILFASVGFLYGYFTRWDKNPQLMTVAYGIMALVCVIETFGYMTSKTKYLAMGAEYVAYLLILILLFTPRFAAYHFK